VSSLGTIPGGRPARGALAARRRALLLLLPLLLPAAALGDPSPLTCRDLFRGEATSLAEELVYSVKWGIVSAGTASLRLSPVVEGGLLTAFRIESEARSNAFVDAFYPVRDRIVSLVSPDFSRSLHFAKSQREGTFSRDEVLEFDQVEGTSHLFRNGKFMALQHLPETWQDPISGIYRFRTLAVNPGDMVRIHATDGRHLIKAGAKVLGRETVSTPAGTFRCLKVEILPESLEGPFVRKKQGRIFVWFSDDDCRIPVKMASEIMIGSVETILETLSYRPVGG
jgi:hypothetical protein